MFNKMVTQFTLRSFTDGTIFSLGMDKLDFIVVALAVLFVFAVSVVSEKGTNVRRLLSTKRRIIRWAVCYGLILCCIIFGAYGMNYTPVDPIYAGF